MNEADFLRLIKKALTTETFVHNSLLVREARQAVDERLEALAQEEMEQADLRVRG